MLKCMILIVIFVSYLNESESVSLFGRRDGLVFRSIPNQFIPEDSGFQNMFENERNFGFQRFQPFVDDDARFSPFGMRFDGNDQQFRFPGDFFDDNEMGFRFERNLGTAGVPPQRVPNIAAGSFPIPDPAPFNPPPVAPPVMPPVGPQVRPPVAPPVMPPVGPQVRPPVMPPVGPQVRPPVAPPVMPQVGPQVRPPVANRAPPFMPFQPQMVNSPVPQFNDPFSDPSQFFTDFGNFVPMAPRFRQDEFFDDFMDDPFLF